MQRASSRAAIAAFLAMEMAREAGARAAAGEKIVRFDVGQPSVGAPEQALQAVRDALGRQALGYTDALGSPALREALSAHYRERYGVEVSPARIAIATGASGAFILAFLALFDTDARVAMAAPGYPPYRHILTALGMRAALVEASLHDRLQLMPHHVRELAAAQSRVGGRVDGVLVASPANPTGSMLTPQEKHALAEAARAIGAPLICDEIYHGLTYEAPASTALKADPDAIVVSSFSKYWAMTGWRVGWLVVPEHLIGAVERLAQNLTVSPPHVSQIAALGALQATDECEARRAIYETNRAALIEALPRVGFTLAAPADGAFYLLVDIGAHSNDSLDFCRRALAETGVAMTAGIDFDETRGHRWVRLAYAREPAEVADGIARLERWLEH